MAYEYLGEGSLDYYPCRYGRSRTLFRGPQYDLSDPYVVAIGGMETYGKFIPKPFPDLVTMASGVHTVNLGYMNAGLDVYLKDPDLMNIIANAEMVILQIMGAGNISNRFYSVHPKRNDRFLHATPFLKSVYRNVDFTEFNFTRHMLSNLQEVSEEKFSIILDELRTAWIARMKSLISAINGKVALLWCGSAPPPQPSSSPNIDNDPLLVDLEMINAVREKVTSYIEYIPSSTAKLRGTQGMVFASLERPIAQKLPNAAIHREVATLVTEEVKHHITCSR